MENTAKSYKSNPAALPPSKRSACYHGYTIHLQVAEWKKLDLSCFDPRDWGWKLDNDILTPLKTDLKLNSVSLILLFPKSYIA